MSTAAEGGVAAKFMDRNLGALDVYTPTGNTKPAKADAYKYFGVLYQHGRPTPFSGQGVGESINTYTAIYNGAATKLSSGSIGGYTQSNTAVSSVTSAIQNPNTYYYNGSYTWYNFADISLWSDYGTNKSIYDLCHRKTGN